MTTGTGFDRRERLLIAATELLEERGPAAVTTRTLVQRAGLSTMAVYSEFGSIGALSTEVAARGYAAVADEFAKVERTADPVADILVQGGTYRAYAFAHPHLYALMSGTASLGGQRSARDPESHVAVFAQTVELVGEAMAAGRLTPAEPKIATAQLLAALHGGVSLEMAGLLGVPDDPFARVLVPLVHSIFVGLGDRPERVAESVANAYERLRDGRLLAVES